MPKAKSSQSSRDNRPRRHKPLPDDIADTGVFRPVSNKRKSRHEDEADGADNYLGSKASRRVLRIGQELADEGRDDAPDQVKDTAFGLESRLDQRTGSDDEAAESDDAWVDEDAWGDGDENDMERVRLHHVSHHPQRHSCSDVDAGTGPRRLGHLQPLSTVLRRYITPT